MSSRWIYIFVSSFNSGINLLILLQGDLGVNISDVKDVLDNMLDMLDWLDGCLTEMEGTEKEGAEGNCFSQATPKKGDS